MRRFRLMAAFAFLVVLDLSLIPISVLLIFVGSVLAPASHGASVPMAVFAAALAIGLISVTFLVGKALWRASPSRRAN